MDSGRWTVEGGQWTPNMGTSREGNMGITQGANTDRWRAVIYDPWSNFTGELFGRNGGNLKGTSTGG